MEEQRSEQNVPFAESAAYLIEHRFPLRHDVEVVARLPNDLTSYEAERLRAWLDALVMEDAEVSGV